MAQPLPPKIFGDFVENGHISVTVKICNVPRYIPDSKEDPQISFVAHLAGVFSGLTIGLVVLRNYEQRLVQCRSWWIAISLLLTLALTALLYHCFSKNDAFRIFCTENCS